MCRVQLTAGCISFYQKLPFLVLFHFDSVYIQQYTLEENSAANGHRIVFSFHSKTETLNELRVCLVKIYDGPNFKTLTVNMHCNTNRGVTSCSCRTTAHIQKVVEPRRNVSIWGFFFLSSTSNS